MVAAIEACTGARCEANLGKPGPEMLATVLGMIGLSADRCLMIGDRLSTDVAMARHAGMDAALVLTGETTPEMLAGTPAAHAASLGARPDRTNCCRSPSGRTDDRPEHPSNRRGRTSCG